MKPTSEGRSGRSLFDKSKVFKFFSFMMFEDSFLSLLSLRIRTESFGHLSKSSKTWRPLNDRARISNFYDQGASLNVINLFSFNSKTTIFLVCEKEPFSIFSILFLFKVKVSNLSHLLKISADISAIWFEDASTFLNPSPKGGNALILLSLMMRCSRVLMPDKSGR